jgi:putative CocE/NonD family hydrolase
MAKRRTLGVLGLGLLGFGLYQFRRQLFSRLLHLRPARYKVMVSRNLQIPMSDGVILYADLYAPRETRLFPTILIRTPYGRNRTSGVTGFLPDFVAQRFAERGYNVVVQDVRGRFDSGGEFVPFVNEASDGRTTLDWLERQSWFNGVLGMWGQSYVGYVQWALAVGGPLYLKALVPSLSGSSIPISGFQEHVLGMDMLFRWIMDLEAFDHQDRPGRWLKWLRMAPGLQDRILKRAFYHLPLLEADRKLVGEPLAYYQDWLTHADPQDGYWRAINFSPLVGKTTAAVNLVSGWYDIFLRETLSDYMNLRASSHSPYLTIGPWSHLDADCLWESVRQGIIWFDAILKGDRRRLRKLPVHIYIMGAGVWREMESWPPLAQETHYYLQGQGDLSLSPPPEDVPPDTYRYDPNDPTPNLGGPLMSRQAGSYDNRRLEARSDVLTFTTQKLERDLEVIGPLRLRLYARSNRVTCDFFARLCDVYPDGRSMNVTDGILRLLPGEAASQADGSMPINIELWPTAYCFIKGHSLRLQIASGAFPRFDRNPGTNEPFGAAVRLLPSEQTVYHDRQHPSVLILPVTSQ